MITPPPIVASVASQIAGHPVRVSCDLANPKLWGAYSFARDIQLRPEICEGIRRFLAGVDDPVSDASVLLITHEAFHASFLPGWRDEGVTECRAWDAVSATGRRFGASADRSALLQQEVSWYHDWAMTLPAYSHGEC